jgi:hypothetical protein
MEEPQNTEIPQHNSSQTRAVRRLLVMSMLGFILQEYPPPGTGGRFERGMSATRKEGLKSMGENVAAIVMPHESLPYSYKGNSDGTDSVPGRRSSRRWR